MTLHILSKGPTARDIVSGCMEALGTGDAVLLIEDGVLCHLLEWPVKFYVLEADAAARGLQIEDGSNIPLIDHRKWVELCTMHSPVCSWF